MSRKYDYAVVIGRFQPIHEGHTTLLNEAFKIATKVIILCGSVNRPRSTKNPWTFFEREQMIRLTVNNDTCLAVCGISDYTYSDQKWVENVQLTINNIIYKGFVDDPSVCIIGHKKDASSFYLDLFPQYDFIEVPRGGPIDATNIRDLYFTDYKTFEHLSQLILSAPVRKFLNSWKKSDSYRLLKEEYQFLETYRNSWKFAPYAPTFITADAVVIESGHILLVKRGNAPGVGQWALPGGFLNQSESIEQCAIRELHEETKLKVPKKVLQGSIKKVKVFDSIDRDPRGRFITHAFLFNLAPCPDPNHKLTPIKGSDDAAYAKWVPLSDLKQIKNEFYLDHWDIIQNMIGGL